MFVTKKSRSIEDRISFSFLSLVSAEIVGCGCVAGVSSDLLIFPWLRTPGPGPQLWRERPETDQCCPGPQLPATPGQLTMGRQQQGAR